MRIPSSCNAQMASGVLSLMGSATPTNPLAIPSTATNMTVCPSARGASTDTRSLARRRVVHDFWFPRPLLDHSRCRARLCQWGSQTQRFAEQDATLAPLTAIAAASRLLTTASSDTTRPGALLIETRCQQDRDERVCLRWAFPSYRRRSVTFRMTSVASAFLKRGHPLVAPPVATAIDIGIGEAERAGRAMIGTATALMAHAPCRLRTEWAPRQRSRPR